MMKRPAGPGVSSGRPAGCSSSGYLPSCSAARRDPRVFSLPLRAYRGPDGGYAYGLEPDVRGPASQPVTVPAALRTLEMAGTLNSDRRPCGSATGWPGAPHPTAGYRRSCPACAPYPHPPWHTVPDEPAGSLGWPPARSPGCCCGPGSRTRGGGLACGVLLGMRSRTWGRRTRTRPKRRSSSSTARPTRRGPELQAERLGRAVREQRIVLLDPERRKDARIAPGYAPGEYHLPARLRSPPGLPGPRVVHRRRDGSQPAVPGRQPAPGRRLAGSLGRVVPDGPRR